MSENVAPQRSSSRRHRAIRIVAAQRAGACVEHTDRAGSVEIVKISEAARSGATLGENRGNRSLVDLARAEDVTEFPALRNGKVIDEIRIDVGQICRTRHFDRPCVRDQRVDFDSQCRIENSAVVIVDSRLALIGSQDSNCRIAHFTDRGTRDGRDERMTRFDGNRVEIHISAAGGRRCEKRSLYQCDAGGREAAERWRADRFRNRVVAGFVRFACGQRSRPDDQAVVEVLRMTRAIEVDVDGAKRILREIAEGTELGRAIGDGALAIGKKRKHHRIPTLKGQALPAWDPRPLKAAGVTYCTSPMGADHTAGLVVEPGQPYEEAVRASQESQIVNAVIDSSGFCQFLMTNLDEVREFYGHFYGEEVTRDQIADQGWQCLEDEWEFNRRAGFGPEDDLMPDCMKQDAIGPEKLVWDLDPELVAQIYKRFDSREELFELRPS